MVNKFIFLISFDFFFIVQNAGFGGVFCLVEYLKRGFGRATYPLLVIELF